MSRLANVSFFQFIAAAFQLITSSTAVEALSGAILLFILFFCLWYGLLVHAEKKTSDSSTDIRLYLSFYPFILNQAELCLVIQRAFAKAMEKLHPLSESLVSLGIMGDQLKAT